MGARIGSPCLCHRSRPGCADRHIRYGAADGELDRTRPSVRWVKRRLLSGDEVAGVVELGGDLQSSAEGLDIGAQYGYGDSVDLAPLHVGSAPSRHTPDLAAASAASSSAATSSAPATAADLRTDTAMSG